MCAVDFLSLFDGDQIQSIAGFPFLDERILHLLVHNEQFFRCIEFSLCSRVRVCLYFTRFSFHWVLGTWMNLTGWEDEPDNMEQRTKEINLFDLNHYLAFNISYVMGKAQSFLFHSLSPVHVYAQFLHLSVGCFSSPTEHF